MSAAIPSARLAGGELDLHHTPLAPELAQLRGERLATPRTLAAARLRRGSESITWIVQVASESEERWARARADGTYEAERAQIEARVRACEAAAGDCFECPDCDREDDERFPAGSEMSLVRLSTSAAGTTVDTIAPLGGGEAVVTFREVRDLDGDGHLEVSVSLETAVDTGQSGVGGTTFRWLDGDTLHAQLDITHRSWAFGCSGELSERSGFSIHDRNGDGHDDVGVRHAVWAAGCDDAEGWNATTGTRLDDAELVRTLALDANAGIRLLDGSPIEEGTDGWDGADEITCPYFEERLRYLYDAASDTWAIAPGPG